MNVKVKDWPNYTTIPYRVLFNGEELSHCIEADSDKGYAVVIETETEIEHAPIFEMGSSRSKVYPVKHEVFKYDENGDLTFTRLDGDVRILRDDSIKFSSYVEDL